MDGTTTAKTTTGAILGLAVKYLPNSNSNHLIILIRVVQAFSLIMAFRKISFMCMICTKKNKSLSFNEIIKVEFSLECNSLYNHKIYKDSIICKATTSELPLTFNQHVFSGCHINAIGSYHPPHREVPTSNIIGSNVVLDDIKSCYKGAGDFLIFVKGKT